MPSTQWWKSGAVYQIYPKSFYDSDGDGIGDINGIHQKLDYIHKLGVSAIWITPFYPSGGYDNGYDVSNYCDVDSVYGIIDDFDSLVLAAHSRNIRVIIDMVFNHTASNHPWFLESRSDKTSDKRDYYIWRDENCGHEPNNWGALFGGPAWTKDENSGQYYLHLFSPEQPDLNWENDEVRKSLYNVLKWWINHGVDGFRFDVISLISKDPNLPDGVIESGHSYGNSRPFVANGPKVHTYLKELRQHINDKMCVGEASDVTIDEALKYASIDESELSMVFQFEHMDLDGGESFKWNDRVISHKELKEVLYRWQIELSGKAWNALFWCNHDQPRIVSRLGKETGELWECSAKMLGAALHLMQGTPYIFQGEELGMTNYPFTSFDELQDPESKNAYIEYTENGMFTHGQMMNYICKKARDNARTPMQWNNEKNAGFSIGTPWMPVNPNYTYINAQKQIDDKHSIFNFYRDIIALRKTYSCLVLGSFVPIEPVNDSIFAYIRKDGENEILVVCNFANESLQCYEIIKYLKNSKQLLSNIYYNNKILSGILAPYQSDVWLLNKNEGEESL